MNLLPLLGSMCLCLAFNENLNIKVSKGLMCKIIHDQGTYSDWLALFLIQYVIALLLNAEFNNRNI